MPVIESMSIFPASICFKAEEEKAHPQKSPMTRRNFLLFSLIRTSLLVLILASAKV
jgi:hypothetical protein